MRRRTRLSLLAVGVLCTLTGAAEAQSRGPAPAAAASLSAPSAVLDAAEADIRTHWIQDRLDAETPAAQRWYWIFLTLSVGATAGQFALGAILSEDMRVGWYVGGINAAIGTIPMIIFPFRPAFVASELRNSPARTPQERIARMHHAEALLRECAEAEDFGAGWAMHTLGAVLGVGSSLVMIGFNQPWGNVVLNLVATVGFNEIQVLTQPTRLIQDWSTYQRDRWRTMATREHRRESVHIMPVPFPGGAGVLVQF